ncbi:uncharacterized protein FOMMEDRAFT_123113 [Fomitiporia mediterranea MF3/22]|uniref:uncharacterized protein n=1 Tax=Fomitiporia mediterranea (strain MF3/22) TaxID=694068 RepID=UPI0004409502|nr:uncharacterized protein FOMMEDRAFT_123113 [Fomitiporia mediterranea MF3/22]EJD02986.1 hypothetical protein FOMMEDRAFT_123113 [Fomitiporia mediterranea MF3/22]
MFSFCSPLRTNSPSPPRSPTSPSSPSNPGSASASEGKDAKSFSERLKHLIKTYGWYALGVYIIIGTLDFGVSFAAINFIGAEHVARVTDAVKSQISSLIHSTPPEPGRQEYETAPPYGSGMGLGLGRKESLYAMIVLAWTVHKTLLLPVRVGLTAAFTPRLVNWLTRRGWAGGEGTKRAAMQMRERVRRGRDRD